MVSAVMLPLLRVDIGEYRRRTGIDHAGYGGKEGALASPPLHRRSDAKPVQSEIEASVPLPTAMAYFVPTHAANSCSNCRPSSPVQ